MQPGTNVHVRAFCQRDLKPARGFTRKVLLRSEEDRENFCPGGGNEKRLRASGDVGKGGHFSQVFPTSGPWDPFQGRSREQDPVPFASCFPLCYRGPWGAGPWTRAGTSVCTISSSRAGPRDRPGAEHHLCLTDSIWSLL